MGSTKSAALGFGAHPDAVFQTRAGEISQVPSSTQRLLDRIFRRTCLTFAWLVIALVVFIVARIADGRHDGDEAREIRLPRVGTRHLNAPGMQVSR